MVIDNGKKYEEAIKIHSEVVKTMDGVGYGLLKDGETFCRYGTDADGILFSMREAYEIHRFLLTSRETHLKERVRKEVEGMRKEWDRGDFENDPFHPVPAFNSGFNNALDTQLDNLK